MQRAVLSQELRGHPGIHSHQEGFRAAALGAAVNLVAKPAHDLDRHCLLGLDHSLAVTGRAPLGEDLAHPIGDVLARHLHQAERRDVHHVTLGLVRVQGLAQRLQDLVAVSRPRHVDEVDDDDPADVAEAKLAHDLVRSLDVDLGDRVLQPPLAAAGEAARVDVDHGQRLRVVDHQIAARVQLDPAREHRLVRLLDAHSLEQRLAVRVQSAKGTSSGAVRWKKLVTRWCWLGSSMIAAVELLGQDVVQNENREVGFLEHHVRGLDLRRRAAGRPRTTCAGSRCRARSRPCSALGGGADDLRLPRRCGCSGAACAGARAPTRESPAGPTPPPCGM